MNLNPPAILNLPMTAAIGCLLLAGCTKDEKPNAPQASAQNDAGPLNQAAPKPVFYTPQFFSVALPSNAPTQLDSLVPQVLSALAQTPNCNPRMANSDRGLPKANAQSSDAGPATIEFPKTKLRLKCEKPEKAGSASQELVWNADHTAQLAPWSGENTQGRVVVWHQKTAHLPDQAQLKAFIQNEDGKAVPAQIWLHQDAKRQELLILFRPNATKSPKNASLRLEWTPGKEKPLKTVLKAL